MVPTICEYDIVRFFFIMGYLYTHIHLLSIADGTSTSRETFVLTTEALSVAALPSGD